MGNESGDEPKKFGDEKPDNNKDVAEKEQKLEIERACK
jgi:hypothetical protein